MNPKQITLGIAAVVLLASIAASVLEYHQGRVAGQLLVDATRTHQADQARMQLMAERIKASEQRQAELSRTLQQQLTTNENTRASLDEQEVNAASKAAADAASAAQKAKAKALTDGQAFLAAYGQAHDMLLSIGKAQIARNYAALILSGSLTPEQVDALETQTAEHWMQTMAVAPNSIHPTDPTLSDDQLQSILGNQGFQQLQNYQRMQPLQGLVNDISSLSISEPLSSQQSTQLLNILANASSSYLGGGKANPQSIDWNQALPQAQGILSSAQISALNAESQLPQVMSLVTQFYKTQSASK